VQGVIPVAVINMANCTGSVPNFILAFIPAEINGDTLNTMTAFAVRGIVYFKIAFKLSHKSTDWWPPVRRFSAFGTTFLHG
jgi:hypothetical protein